jgi:hypothetical protein
MSALIQSFSSLSLSSRTLRGDAKVASPSTRAMPKNRTAVVTEAVRCFFLFFWALPPIFFLHFAVVFRRRRRRGVITLLENTVSRDFRFFYASEIVLRSIPSRDDVFVRRVGIGGGRRRSRAEIFFFALGKFYPRERSFFSLFRFLLRKKPLSLSSVFVKDKKYTDMHTLACFITTLSLSLFPSLLEFTEKEMGKTSVKPKRQTVASEDARENERQGHRHRRRG